MKLDRQLRAALEAVEPVLAASGERIRLDDEGQLVVGRLPAEDLPEGTEELRDAVGARLPHLQISSLLIEVDASSGFTDYLTHAGGATHRSPELRRNLYAALLAQATNQSLAEMAGAIQRDGGRPAAGRVHAALSPGVHAARSSVQPSLRLTPAAWASSWP